MWTKNDFIYEGDVILGFSKDGFNKLQKNKFLVIPYGTKGIGNFAFSNRGLVGVALPESLEFIGDGAFSSNKISELEIPMSVHSIGHSCFCGNRLEEVDIENNIIKVSPFAFFGNASKYVNRLSFNYSY